MRVARLRAAKVRPGRASAIDSIAPIRATAPSRNTKRVRVRSSTSAGSASGPSQPRKAMRCTATPPFSSARISRRMKLWLTAG